MISGARSLLFVHQSIYGVAVEGMKKKLNRLHTEMQPTVEKADFIRRSQPSIIDPMETFRQGAKVHNRASSLHILTYFQVEQFSFSFSCLRNFMILKIYLLNVILENSMSTLSYDEKVISTEDGDPDFTYPSIVYDIGTSASLVTSSVVGSGHILVIIPYRSVSELISLANNFDIHNETYVFASNVDFFSTVAKQLKVIKKGTSFAIFFRPSN